MIADDCCSHCEPIACTIDKKKQRKEQLHDERTFVVHRTYQRYLISYNTRVRILLLYRKNVSIWRTHSTHTCKMYCSVDVQCGADQTMWSALRTYVWYVHITYLVYGIQWCTRLRLHRGPHAPRVSVACCVVTGRNTYIHIVLRNSSAFKQLQCLALAAIHAA